MENYRRFYAIFNQLSSPFGRDELKETLVSSFTDGRTSHLHEMTQKEYKALCDSLEERTGWKDQLKKSRSLCLKLMQKLGIDTTVWQRINDFCQNPKIAGKVFAQLGVDDLGALQVKLRAILRKGGLKKREEPKVAVEPQHTEPLKYVMAVPLQVMGNA